MQVRPEGQGAENLEALRVRGQPLLRIREQRDVAAKAVDDRSEAAGAVRRGDQTPETRQLRKDPAAVDVADEQPTAVDVVTGPQVDQIALQEIQLHRTAGPLHQQHIALLAPAVEHLSDRLPQAIEVPVVFGGRAMSLRLAEHHNLRAQRATRLEQDGIHLHGRRQSTGFRLHRLGSADLAAVEGHPRVVGHVLGLERSNAHPLRAQPCAERRGDPAFAGPGAATQNGDRFHGGHYP